MPNPFATDDRSYIPAAPEDQEVRPLVRSTGWVFPNRGAEAHGVNPNLSKPDPENDVFDMGEVTPEPQKEPSRATTPMPVRIVNEGGKEDKRWRAYPEEATGDVRQIVGRNESRTSLQIKNIGTVRVWLSSGDYVRKNFGWPLDANQSLSLAGYDAVYAVSDDGSVQELAVMQEYTVSMP